MAHILSSKNGLKIVAKQDKISVLKLNSITNI